MWSISWTGCGKVWRPRGRTRLRRKREPRQTASCVGTGRRPAKRERRDATPLDQRDRLDVLDRDELRFAEERFRDRLDEVFRDELFLDELFRERFAAPPRDGTLPPFSRA